MTHYIRKHTNSVHCFSFLYGCTSPYARPFHRPRTHLEYAGSDGDVGQTLTHGLHERVDGARVTVLLYHVTARAQERAQLTGQCLQGTRGKQAIIDWTCVNVHL